MASFCERILICLMINPESIYYLSEIGIKAKQEDYIWPIAGKATVNDKVFIVCDGSGSYHSGETASKLICQFMAAKVLKFGEQKMSGELINKLLIEARDRLITYAWKYRLDTDLGTTFSMLILYNQKVLMSWYGDSRIYHLRGGEILFRTEDNSLVSKPIKNTAIARGIKADGSPIYAGTKWIENVQDGDYFLLCSKGIIENVTDDDIKLLVSQNDNAKIDLTGSFRRLAFEKSPDNYSMYLIRVNVGTQKRGINSRIIAIRKQTSKNVRPIFILAMTIVVLLIMVFYFRKARISDPAFRYRNQTTQPVDILRDDSVPSAIIKSAPRNEPVDVLRDDSVPSAIVMSTPRYQPVDALRDDSVRGAIVMTSPPKPILALTDSVKNNSENPPAASQNDKSAAIQAEEKPEQTNQTAIGQKKRVAQLLIKLTTDESCKLKITNMDLDEVIDWDLSPNDNGSIYLKPGKNSIVATSVIDSSKTKTYNFDVKPGNAHTTQNLHIRF
jgi:serine/threonine protein phosphatase PrpC